MLHSQYLQTLSLILAIHHSAQECPEETLERGVSVSWLESDKDEDVASVPACYVNDHLLTRSCNGTHWTPPLDELTPCTNVTKELNHMKICPPGSYAVSNNNSNYCYTIEDSSQWTKPCFDSGFATVITDLSTSDIESLLSNLRERRSTRYYWLPARRPGVFLAPAWNTPGPNYGQTLMPNEVVDLNLSLWKNCIALDILLNRFTTETCSLSFPSLCLFINDLQKPTKCPNGYYSSRFMQSAETCFGIEFAENSKNDTFDNLRSLKCATPMGDHNKFNSDLVRFLFYKIASLKLLPEDYWCWFGDMHKEISAVGNITANNQTFLNQVVINSRGTIRLMKSHSLLPCIACETNVVYGETKLMLDYNEHEQKIYLTVYYPSGLWKYENGDKGIRCFSNVKGPVNAVDISDPLPLPLNVSGGVSVINSYLYVEKLIYVIELPSLTPAEYWCIGHTKQFNTISTEKIVINPQGSNLHVFSLFFEVDVTNVRNQSAAKIISNIMTNLQYIFQVENIVFMDIIKKSDDEIMTIAHLQSLVKDIHKNDAMNVLETFDRLKETAMTILPTYNYTFVNISSATHCLPDWSEDIITLHWDITPIGHMTTPEEFCLQNNSLPVVRHCDGSYVWGAFWENVVGRCNPDVDPSSATTYLYNFVSGKLSDEYASRFLSEGLSFVLGDIDIIIPADVYYLAVSLQFISNAAQTNSTLFEMTDINHITWVMDRIMSLNTHSLRLAQTLNSTNLLLDTVENLIEFLSRPKYNINIGRSLHIKYYEITAQPKFMVQISYPHQCNITGIAISKILDSDDFRSMKIQPLYKNTSFEDVISIENLEIATWLPENLLASLEKNTSMDNHNDNVDDDLSLIITVFYDDSVFQQLEESARVVNSRIVGVSIPGYYSNLRLPMPLLFREINVSDSRKHCVFWDFHQHDNNLPGLWSEEGCYFVKTENGINVCECYHLTHFGNLVLNIGNNAVEDRPRNSSHLTALNIISLVGCFLSLLGIIGIWITALVFKTWRKKAGTKILLHLTIAVALPLIIFVVFNLDTSIFLIENDESYYMEDGMKPICILLGVLIHYSILASFLWMLITAILQFMRYVRVLGTSRPKRFTMKLSLIAWGLPVLPVLVVLLVDKNNYIPDLSNINEHGLICYPKGILSIICVTVPVCIILVINILIFLRIIYAISRGLDGKKRKADIDLVQAQMRLSIFLFFLLGLTWVFGLFSFSSNYVWSYLFCLTSTMQGLVLFIYFVVCDPSTRNLWVTLIKPQFVSSASRESISTGSSTACEN